jgi:hypothetical protein
MLQQSTIQKLASPTRWLRSGCFLIDATSLWDPGWSHNLQRCLQPYLKVNGVLLPQWLHRPAYHWRTARSTSRCMCPRRPCDPPPAALTSSLPWIAPPCSYLVSRHMCYLVFFRGPFCKLTVVMSICVCVRESLLSKKTPTLWNSIIRHGWRGYTAKFSLLVTWSKLFGFFPSVQICYSSYCLVD